MHKNAYIHVDRCISALNLRNLETYMLLHVLVFKSNYHGFYLVRI